jgi:hypothetical protein
MPPRADVNSPLLSSPANADVTAAQNMAPSGSL